VKNITVSLDDEAYRLARVRAAERGASVSALVRQFLAGLASEENQADRMKREEARLRDSIQSFRAADRVSHDDLHRRGG
jgi:plasmid stability protein